LSFSISTALTVFVLASTVLREGDSEELGRFVAIGPADFRLPPGTLHVTISRGIEHDIHQQDITLAAGATASITGVDLAHVVDTAGWVSGDYHLHTEFSTDSMHPVDEALRRFASEGLDLVTATEHDFINHYARRTAAAGVDAWLVVIDGIEISSTVIGHIQSYPARHDPTKAGAGAVVWFGLSPTAIFDAADAIGDTSMGPHVTQVNHPRGGSSFFDYVRLDPATGHATATAEDLMLPAGTDPDDFDFDAVEVWNGTRGSEDEDSFVDWLSLAANGRPVAMIGNSDTHVPRRAAGTPRTYTRVPDDTRGNFDWADVGASILAHDVTVSGGIFVTAEVTGARAAGMVPVHVRVQAAPWVECTTLRVWAGAEEVLTRPITATDPVRLDETIDVPIGTAGFVVVRADGPRATEPALGGAPFGVTNELDVP
jgi:hypothetical protein